MTDKELLTLAAKAVGVEIEYWTGDTPRVVEMFRGHLPNYNEWNPLADDGDALRLAVKLQLTICNEHVSNGAVYCTRGEDEDYPSVTSGTTEPRVQPEDYAATRRAIVRAAASIAKEQQND